MFLVRPHHFLLQEKMPFVTMSRAAVFVLLFLPSFLLISLYAWHCKDGAELTRTDHPWREPNGPNIHHGTTFMSLFSLACDHGHSMSPLSSLEQATFSSPVGKPVNNRGPPVCCFFWWWRCMASCVSSVFDMYQLEQHGACTITMDAIAFLMIPTAYCLVLYYRRTRGLNTMAVAEDGAEKPLDSVMISNICVQKFFCKICMEHKSLEQSFQAEHCMHLFCFECVAENVASKIRENSTTFLCMEFGCMSKIELESCRSILPGELLDRWALVLSEAVVLSSDSFYCPYKDCSALMWVDRTECRKMTARQTVCPHCCRLLCAQCKVSWHAGMSCYKFQKLNKRCLGKNEWKVKELAIKMGWQRCPSCRIFVERTSGCVHIACRCGFQFCYMCGSSWTNYKHKCTLKRLMKYGTSWSTWKLLVRRQLRWTV